MCYPVYNTILHNIPLLPDFSFIKSFTFIGNTGYLGTSYVCLFKFVLSHIKNFITYIKDVYSKKN